MAGAFTSFSFPGREPLMSGEYLSFIWEWFMRRVFERLSPLGEERSFAIANNQAVAVDVDGLKFDSSQITQAIIEFMVVRVTTGGGATELVESGMFIVVYKPTSNAWAINLVNINSPQNSGVDFTVTTAGQVQYTSSNVTGTASISRLYYRARTLGGKNAQFSSPASGR